MAIKQYTRVDNEWVQILEPRDEDQYLLNATGTTVHISLMLKPGDPDSVRTFALGGTIGQMRISPEYYAYAKADTDLVTESDSEDTPVIPESIIVSSPAYTPPSGEVKNELTAITNELIKLTKRVTHAEVKIEKHWLRYIWFTKEVLRAQRDLQEQIAGFVFNLFYLQRQFLKVSMFFEKQKSENKRLEYLIHFYDKTEEISKINRSVEDIINHLQILNNYFSDMKPKTDALSENFLEFVSQNHEHLANLFKDILNHNRRIFLVERAVYKQQSTNKQIEGQIDIATERTYIDRVQTDLNSLAARVTNLDVGFISLKNNVDSLEDNVVDLAETASQVNNDRLEVMQADISHTFRLLLNHNKRIFAAERFIISQRGKNISLENLIIQSEQNTDSKISDLQGQIIPILSSVNAINSKLAIIEPQIDKLMEDKVDTSPEGIEALKNDLRSLQSEFSSLNNAFNTLAVANSETDLNRAFNNIIADCTDPNTIASITAIRDLLIEIKRATEINDDQADELTKKLNTSDKISLSIPKVSDMLDDLTLD